MTESSFESSLARLEAIVSELEGQDLPLDRALVLFEEGVERLRTAAGALERAEARLQVLTEQVRGTLEVVDFDG